MAPGGGVDHAVPAADASSAWLSPAQSPPSAMTPSTLQVLVSGVLSCWSLFRHALPSLLSPEMSLSDYADGGSLSRVEGADPGVQSALKDFRELGGTMPFVNIRLIEGRSQQRKD